MTTTGRLPEQPQRPQTPTASRPVDDRSASGVARIQGLKIDLAFVDELATFQPDGHVIYAATNPDSGEEWRVALARLGQAVGGLGLAASAIRSAMIAFDRPGRVEQAQLDQWEPPIAWGPTRSADDVIAALTAITGDPVDEPPADAKARALWLRQHRNTGPQTTRHARRSSW